MAVAKVGSASSSVTAARVSEEPGQQFDRLAGHFENALQTGARPLLPSLKDATTEVLESLYVRLQQGAQAGTAGWAPKTPELKQRATAAGEAAGLVGKELRARGVDVRRLEPTLTPMG